MICFTEAACERKHQRQMARIRARTARTRARQDARTAIGGSGWDSFGAGLGQSLPGIVASVTGALAGVPVVGPMVSGQAQSSSGSGSTALIIGGIVVVGGVLYLASE